MVQDGAAVQIRCSQRLGRPAPRCLAAERAGVACLQRWAIGMHGARSAAVDCAIVARRQCQPLQARRRHPQCDRPPGASGSGLGGPGERGPVCRASSLSRRRSPARHWSGGSPPPACSRNGQVRAVHRRTRRRLSAASGVQPASRSRRLHRAWHCSGPGRACPPASWVGGEAALRCRPAALAPASSSAPARPCLLGVSGTALWPRAGSPRLMPWRSRVASSPWSVGQRVAPERLAGCVAARSSAAGREIVWWVHGCEERCSCHTRGCRQEGIDVWSHTLGNIGN